MSTRQLGRFTSPLPPNEITEHSTNLKPYS
jgi:hypothetical protein